MEHPDHRDRRSVIWRRQSATASSALIAPAWRGAAYVAGRLTTTLEVIARVSGELGDLAKTTTYNIGNVTNVAVLAEHPTFLRMQAILLRALAPFPDARMAVVEALRELDNQNAPVPLSGLAIGCQGGQHVPA